MITKGYKILPTQIPMFWEAIKFTCVQANNVAPEEVPTYCRELLISLLSGKAICMVALDDNKVLLAVLVCRIMVDRFSAKKYLLLQGVYAWEKLNDSIWLQAFELFLEFARLEKCDYITTISNNPKVWSNLAKIGFVEEGRTLTLHLERR